MTQHRRFNALSLFALLLPVAACAADPAPEDTEVWEPVPAVVAPHARNGAPSDAFILFSSDGLAAWEQVDGGPAAWKVGDGWFEVVPGTGDIRTRQTFGDVQLHIEWSAPTRVEGDGQGRGNSGIFLQQRYEVQVLDSFDNRTYSNGQAASIYKQHIPLVNATTAPGTWQVYDIVFHAPVFAGDGSVRKPATVTVFHNGILVQDHVEIRGSTTYEGAPVYTSHGDDALRLQDHDNPVRYRNIWIRELGSAE